MGTLRRRNVITSGAGKANIGEAKLTNQLGEH